MSLFLSLYLCLFVYIWYMDICLYAFFLLRMGARIFSPLNVVWFRGCATMKDTRYCELYICVPRVEQKKHLRRLIYEVACIIYFFLCNIL